MKKTMLAKVAACMAAISMFGGISQAATVSSDPAAAITLNLKSMSETSIGVSVLRPSIFEGRVASVDVANQKITFQGSPNFDVNGLVTGGSHFVYIKSGVDEGMWVTITANTADTVTVELAPGDRLTNIGVGEVVAIVPHWTMATFFGPNPPNEMTLYLYRTTMPIQWRAASDYFQHFHGVWYDTMYNNAENFVIKPGEAIVVGNYTPADVLIHVPGVAPMAAYRTVVQNRGFNQIDDQRFAFVSAVPQLISQIFKNAENTDYIFLYNNESTGFNKAIDDLYFYHAGEWYSGANYKIVTNTFKLHPGVGYIYSKFNTPTPKDIIMQAPQPYLD